MDKINIPLAAVLRVAEAVVEVCNVSDLMETSDGMVQFDLFHGTAVVTTPGFCIEDIALG